MVLDKLEQITPSLPIVHFFGEFRSIRNGIISYRLNKGETISESIYSTEDLAICKLFIPKGRSLDTHIHLESDEWLIILEGTLGLELGDDYKLLSKYESIKITADKSHKAIAVESSTIIAITVPRDDGFPD